MQAQKHGSASCDGRASTCMRAAQAWLKTAVPDLTAKHNK